ncbi:peroxidase [Sarracenia purpurea var. burkii]
MELRSKIVVVVLGVSLFWFGVEGGLGVLSVPLSYGFYERKCPEVEEIVRVGLQSISLSDPTSPAALLRLMFHDCQVQVEEIVRVGLQSISPSDPTSTAVHLAQGCDASILVDSSAVTASSEMDSPKNFGVRKRESISAIKSMVEAACPQQVSCADILVLAAREAVAMAGGPRIVVPLGRRDSPSPPSHELADVELPPANLGVDGMLQIFEKKGMTVEESVAIMGRGGANCHP